MNCFRSMTSKFLLVTLSVYCLGCSGGDSVDLGTVSGVITMDGAPLPDAIVVFVPEKGNPSTGRTDTSGKYELSYLGDAKGAVVGSHSVKITTGEPLGDTVDGDTDLANVDISNTTEIETPPVESDGDLTQSRPRPRPKKGDKDPIPAKYNSKTELKADVTGGDNTINFDLKSK
ncbi:carboxypeptidase regulatory-like domain-containing protein [Gimesia sp.]|uniref:carboxypeptidase regulatory-like domain-containing protein n=1 Tax=Gimesia sp. TaxID=2024833 RepID=UPI003A8E6D9D